MFDSPKACDSASRPRPRTSSVRSTWTGNLFFVCCLAIALTGCSRSIRVIGVVSDSTTGAPIWPCSVTIGSRSAMVDLAGRYNLQAWKVPPSKNVAPAHRDMEVLCQGYESQTISIPMKGTRTPVINVQMKPSQVPTHEPGHDLGASRGSSAVGPAGGDEAEGRRRAVNE